jgi:hypothetical protein
MVSVKFQLKQTNFRAYLETVMLFKVSATELDKVGSPMYVAVAVAIFVVISVVACDTTPKPYARRGGYLFSSGSISGLY